MILYRVCGESEKNDLINKSLESIGKYGSEYLDDKIRCNNHRYKRDTKYMHFFESIYDIFYAYWDFTYLCVYEIPDNIALKYKGLGYYYDLINFKELKSINEYAIDIKDMCLDYLKEIYNVSEIDFDECIMSDLNKNLKLIYKG